MKMVKKILLGLSAAAAVLALASCGLKTDDEQEAIKGAGSKYTIDFENNEDVVDADGNRYDPYRCYKTLKTKHSGGTFKITLKPNAAAASDGVMGIIWDLKTHDQSKKSDESAPRDFFIAGIRYNYHQAKKLSLYASKYQNVTDLSASNFGATAVDTLTDTGACQELQLTTDTTGLTKKSYGFYMKNDDYTLAQGNGSTTEEDVIVVVDIATTEDGGYTVTFYDSTVLADTTKNNVKLDESKKTSATIASYNISSDVTGYEDSEDEQYTIAVYANVAKDQTLTGSWIVGSLINELEVEEY